MIIVFEGPNGAGKSTLANFIQSKLKNLGYRVKFFPTEPEPKTTSEVSRIWNNAKFNDPEYDFIIHDRFFPICEQVYSGALGRPLKVHKSLLDDTISQIDLAIFCSTKEPKIDLSPEHVLARGGMKEIEKIQKKWFTIRDNYDMIFNEIGKTVKVIDYDFATSTKEDILEKILQRGL